MTIHNQDLQLSVESVAFGGSGIARHEGKVYFIEGTIPGDRIEAKVLSEKKRYAEAEVTSFLERSPLRRPSPCPVSDECGGCQWQEVDYQNQLDWKRNFVEAALQRIGMVQVADIKIHPSKKSHNYRGRILVRCHSNEEGRIFPGYFRRASRELVEIKSCAIAEDSLNTVLRALQEFIIPEAADQRFRLEIQSVPASDHRCFATIFPAFRNATAALQPVAEALRNLPQVLWAGMVFDTHTAGYYPFDKDDELSRTFFTTPGQFQQVNFEPNRVLRRKIYDLVESLPSSRVFDLFCGSGNLSLALVNSNRHVAGVEGNAKSIACARYNLQANNLLLPNATNYVAMDATKRLWQAVDRGETYDCVITDPPREGMAEAVQPLLRLAPEHIIYVSCDPATLARDISMLCRSAYELVSVEAFDFFPNTFHVETLALLRRLK